MIPSLLQIPSAVSDSKLHSVLPNNGKGDFQFDRSTGATRINRDGLIEEVGYFSSELVQNGNFSELGSELITNGDFASNIDNWAAKDCTIVWDNGKLKCNNSSGNSNGGARQNVGLQNSKTYKLVATVQILSADSNGTFNLFTSSAGGTGQSSVYSGSTLVAGGDAVTETAYFTTGTDGDVSIQFSVDVSNAIYTIDNVSVKQVDPNDRWTFTSGRWKLEDNKATFFDSAGGVLYQSGLTLTSGKKYKLTFNISNASGNASIWIGNSAGGVNYEGGSYRAFSNGNHTVIFNMPSNQTTLAFFANTSVFFSITNISLVEVQGDRPRLSYDITNGIVEDKPHLLLENSSTNLITFSEDFSQSAWGKGDAQILSATHKNPDGTTNAKVLAYNGGTNQHYMSFSPSVSSGQDYTFSVFLKAKELKFVCLIFLNGVAGRYFDLENGTVLGTFGATPTDSKIEDFGNGWYRCSITDSATSTTKFSGVYLSENGTSIDSITPTTTNGVYVWGAMMEQQSYATSYIPTAGTTITRAAETCNNSKPSVNSTEGVLYADINIPENIDSNVNISLSAGVHEQNLLKIIYLPSVPQLRGELNVSSSVQTILADNNFVLGTYNKIGLVFNSSTFEMYINGIKIGSASTSGLPSGLNQFNLDRADGNAPFYGKVKGLAVYNEALSESQLMQLTGVTASSIYSNFVTRTASFTVEALNEVKKVIDNL